MTVIDTSVWIAFLRGETTTAVAALHGLPLPEILVGDLILLEILRGARDDRHARKIEGELRAFPIARMLDGTTAVEAAQHYRALRTLGVTVRKISDLIIATYCIAKGHALLHQDRDFEPFVKHQGLHVVV